MPFNYEETKSHIWNNISLKWGGKLTIQSGSQLSTRRDRWRFSSTFLVHISGEKLIQSPYRSIYHVTIQPMNIKTIRLFVTT